MKKNKMLACLAMAGILAIGAGTYAIFSDKTDEKRNVFTIGSGIDGDIFEPNWPGNDDGEVEYKPGSAIPKDPQIKNTSTSESAYVGIQLRYVLPKDAYVTYNTNNDTKYENNKEVLDVLGYESAEDYIKTITSETVYNNEADTFVINTKNALGREVDGYWVPLTVDKTTLANSYMYVDVDGNPLKLPATGLTEPIFKEVKIVKDIDIENMMPFEIRVQGYLVQTSDGINAAEELMSLMRAK